MSERPKLTQLPGSFPIKADVASVAAATSTETAVWMNKTGARVKVQSVGLVPSSAIVGDNTNSTTLSIQNKGLLGAGVVEVASKAFVTGVGAPIFDETSITPTVTDANLYVEDGEALTLKKVDIGSGLALPKSVLNIVLRFE